MHLVQILITFYLFINYYFFFLLFFVFFVFFPIVMQFNIVKLLLCETVTRLIVNRFKRAGYSLDIMLQTACLVFNPIMVECYAALFSCTAVVQASDSMTASM